MVARSGVLPDRFLVEKPLRVVPKDPPVLFFQARPYAPHKRDRQTLWPTMTHEPQSVQQREGLVVRKPILYPFPGRIVAEEREVGVILPCGSRKDTISVEQTLQFGAQFLGWLRRLRLRLQQVRDRLLDLVAFVFKHWSLLTGSNPVRQAG